MKGDRCEIKECPVCGGRMKLAYAECNRSVVIECYRECCVSWKGKIRREVDEG